jgi:hypothetical protein
MHHHHLQALSGQGLAGKDDFRLADNACMSGQFCVKSTQFQLFANCSNAPKVKQR